MRRAAACLVVGGLLAAGCGPRDAVVTPDVGLTPQQAAERLRADQARRLRMEAVYKATLPGVLGALPGVDVEVFAEKPGRLHIEAKSFFEQPMVVIASDGTSVTVYDALDPAGPQWKKGDAQSGALDRYLPVALSPDDVVHVCLGAVPPFERVRGFEADDGAGHYTLTLERADRTLLQVRAAHGTDHIAEVEFCQGPADCPVRVRATDYGGAGDVSLPHGLSIEVQRGGGAPDVVGLEVKRGTMNGPAFPDALFSVPPPPGGSYSPL